jgi:uncharacterized membrane protein required for colicin V production
MIPIHTVFGSLIILFAVIGGLRGWAKEVIVVCSVIVALFVEHVFLNIITPIGNLVNGMAPESRFYIRSIVFIVIAMFGYASPTLATRLGAKVVRERLQDILLGFFLGLVNGLLIIGTILSFLNAAYYGVPAEMRHQEPVLDEQGQPVVDQSGNPVMRIVYHPGASGIGGTVPPASDSTTARVLPHLPPEVVRRSTAVLFISVAVAFVFVLVVLI